MYIGIKQYGNLDAVTNICHTSVCQCTDENLKGAKKSDDPDHIKKWKSSLSC